jgi:histone-lysine N-methyltransferase ASH1L
MQLSCTLFIDARKKGNQTRFVNHSCDPNCRYKKINVDGLPRIAVVCIKDVPAGSFLSCDYLDAEFDIRCRCGSARCRGRRTIRPHT